MSQKVPVKLIDFMAWDAKLLDTPDALRAQVYEMREELLAAQRQLNDLLMELSRRKKPMPIGLQPEKYFAVRVSSRPLEDAHTADMGGEYRWLRGWAIDLNSAFIALHEALNVPA
jgi:hypothetical protein